MDKKKILFVGHDFKFLTHIMKHFSRTEKYEVAQYYHKDHVIQDFTGLTKECLNADIIFCEWGLENLSWLSKNKFPDQKLIVRIHSQEFYTDFLKLTNWQEVDKIVLVSPHMTQQFSRIFRDQKHKVTLIHNVIDCHVYNQQKTKTSAFNVGLIGILPKLKAPHFGLELLSELKKSDQRFKLFIKSKKPEELDWLLKKNEEVEYYDHFQSEIKRMNFEDSVIWEDHGNNVQEWFTKIGFILSSSDREAFHMSVAEGMASGAIPVIRNWEGADQLYPKKFIFRDMKEAARIIITYSEEKKREKEAKYLKNYAEKHFGLDVILKQYEQLFDEVAVSINNNQQKITLRSIYNNISTEQNKNTEECNKKIQELDEILSALNNELSEKNRTIKDVCKDSQEKESIIHELQKEVASKIQKIDSIISVADEMKEQLSSGREREKQQMKELTELRILHEKATQKFAHITAQLGETKTQLTIIQEELNVSRDRESIKEHMINELNKSIEEQAQKASMLKKQLAEKDLLLQEKHQELTDINNRIRNMAELNTNRENSIIQLKGKLTSMEQSIKDKQIQIVEQKQYINYLEKRFFNKMIGFIRKKFKTQTTIL